MGLKLALLGYFRITWRFYLCRIMLKILNINFIKNRLAMFLLFNTNTVYLHLISDLHPFHSNTMVVIFTTTGVHPTDNINSISNKNV